MCGNIKKLRFDDRPASDEEVYKAALQYVRKVSACRKPSAVNSEAYDAAVEEIAASLKTLLNSLKVRPKVAK